MIVRPRPHWFRLLFVMRGSVLPDIAPALAAVGALAALVTVFDGRVLGWKVPLGFVPFSLIGLTLAIFLAFRNNTCYARYWEARGCWGTVLNETRTLLRQALTLGPPPAEASRFGHLLIAFVHALRHQVRQTAPARELWAGLPDETVARIEAARHKPALILLLAAEWLRDRRQAGQLEPILLAAMEPPLARLTEALGGCERLASTPIPFPYFLVIHRTVFLYCLLLPFGLVDSAGPLTPLMVVFIAYTFLALQAIGDQIEDPFGTQPNDLALDAISAMIEDTLRETMGEPQVAGAPRPVNHVLS